MEAHTSKWEVMLTGDNDGNRRTKQDAGQMKEPEMSDSLQTVVALQC